MLHNQYIETLQTFQIRHYWTTIKLKWYYGSGLYILHKKCIYEQI